MELLMLENITHFEFLLVAGSLVGVWIKHQMDYARLVARVEALEGDNSDFKKDVKTLLKDIQEIKLLLAKNKVV
jgi:hypothetical protein